MDLIGAGLWAAEAALAGVMFSPSHQMLFAGGGAVPMEQPAIAYSILFSLIREGTQEDGQARQYYHRKPSHVWKKEVVFFQTRDGGQRFEFFLESFPTFDLEFTDLSGLVISPDHLRVVSDEALGEAGTQHDASWPVTVQASNVTEPVDDHSRSKP